MDIQINEDNKFPVGTDRFWDGMSRKRSTGYAVVSIAGSRAIALSSLQSTLRNFLAHHLFFAYPQTRLNAIEEIRERALVLRCPRAHARPQVNRPPRRARLIVDSKVLLQAVAHHRRARRNSIHAENCKLRLSQPPDHITSPATSLQQRSDVVQRAIRCSRPKRIAQRLQILKKHADQYHRAS